MSAPVSTLGIRVAPLDHKTGDDSMKCCFVIEILLSQFGKIFDMSRGIFREKPKRYVPESGMNDCVCLSQQDTLLSWG